MAKMAGGHADDLASTVLLATTLPILIAPAMNVRMWLHPATQRNLATLQTDGVRVVGPNEGAMAEAETGPEHVRAPGDRRGPRTASGAVRASCRKARDRDLRADARAHRPGALHRQPLLRQAGPRHREGGGGSGRQGDAGLRPRRPAGSRRRHDGSRGERARHACRRGEGAARHRHFAAAVADWRVANAGGQKIKKNGGKLPELALAENPDILATIAHRNEGRRL